FYLLLGCPSCNDLLSDFCSSQPSFAICFLQISPPRSTPCSAHNKKTPSFHSEFLVSSFCCFSELQFD
ncbi:hypothetical protein FCV58_02685, partial [Vibrio sp. F13]